jgi:DNA repair protein RadC
MKIVREIRNADPVKSAKEVYKYLKEFMYEDREHVVVIGLDNRNRPVFREIVSIGIVDSALVCAREVFKKAIICSCRAIIIAHNHPSGSQEASAEDINMRDVMSKAGKILGIEVLDFLIITETGFISYREGGSI